jgi:selenocysteine lyase/cysteine desulfurase
MSNSHLKSRFPIFGNNPELVYLDNAATTQKPDTVLAAMD